MTQKTKDKDRERIFPCFVVPVSHDPLPMLTVDDHKVFYDGKLIFEAASHDEAAVYRDKLINIYT